MKKLLLAVTAVAVAAGCSPSPTPRVLVFSKTEGYRHASIEPGQMAFRQMATERGFTVRFTEDAAAFNPDTLATYHAVVFLNTTGDVLDQAQQESFKRFIQAGGGYVGVHAATDTEYGWSWYGQLAGGYFDGHPGGPNVRPGDLTVVDAAHPATAPLPTAFTYTDEFYDFRAFNPDVNVLLSVDERSYKRPEEAPSDAVHPLAWYHAFDGGRAFYTALGHTEESYTDSLFLLHLWGGLDYALGERRPLDFSRASVAPEENRFTRVVLDENLNEPMELAVLGAGRVLFVERNGAVFVHDEARGAAAPAGSLAVFYGLEEGLLGVAADPGFDQNRWLYFAYSHPERPVIQLGRFTLTEADTLDPASETVLLEIPVQRENACCHVGGSVAFGPDGTLFVSVGDNTNPFESSGMAPIDERPDRDPWDAQRSAANANDLRGKILRITPQPDGSYTIPDGNLFTDAAEGRPEIYVMGNRNPFRIAIDPATGDLYWGEVGPDAGEPDAARGPKGYDEINRARSAGFFGWPYLIADNKPYHDYDFAAAAAGAPFDAARPVNDSPHNTGANRLPAAQPAFIWYPYDASDEFPEVETGSRTSMAGPLYRAGRYGATPSLPAYFDGRLFIYEWGRSWIKTVAMDEDGSYRYMEPFMPGTSWSRPMDMEMGPDGTLYVLEYGTNWNARNPDARLSRIDYNGGNRAPEARIAEALGGSVAGAAPFTVTLTAEATDADRDAVSFEWDLGDGQRARGATVTHTYTARGTYDVRLRATDDAGGTGTATAQVQVGNAPPALALTLGPNASFYWTGEPIDYEVQAEDAEDGTLGQGIDPGTVVLTMAYLPEGVDEAEVQRGHQGLRVRTAGEVAMEVSDCGACHQMEAASVGPSYVEIAARYRGQDAEARLVRKVIEGGGGVWGDRAMAAHPQLTDDEAGVMVRAILALADSSGVERLPLSGRYVPQAAPGSEGRYLATVTYTDRGGEGTVAQTRRTTAVLRSARVQAEHLTGPTLARRRGAYTDDPFKLGYTVEIVGAVDGEYLTLPQVELRGLREVAAEVIRNPLPGGAEGGWIELRLGAPDGLLVGTFGEVVPTPSGVSVQRVTARLQNVPAGRHDLYLVFRTQRAGGTLGNLDWIEFGRPAP